MQTNQTIRGKLNLKTMTRKQIEALSQQGKSMDEIYRIAAGNMGLFGVAFFGHKAKPGEKSKLSRVWNRIVDYHKGL